MYAKSLPRCCSFFYFRSGELAEWSIAVVLKTTDLHGSGGSNPSLSAKYDKSLAECEAFFVMGQPRPNVSKLDSERKKPEVEDLEALLILEASPMGNAEQSLKALRVV